MCVIQPSMRWDSRCVSPPWHIFLDLKSTELKPSGLSFQTHTSKKVSSAPKIPSHGVLTTATERRPRQCSPVIYWQGSTIGKPCVFLAVTQKLKTTQNYCKDELHLAKFYGKIKNMRYRAVVGKSRSGKGHLNVLFLRLENTLTAVFSVSVCLCSDQVRTSWIQKTS